MDICPRASDAFGSSRHTRSLSKPRHRHPHRISVGARQTCLPSRQCLAYFSQTQASALTQEFWSVCVAIDRKRVSEGESFPVSMGNPSRDLCRDEEYGRTLSSAGPVAGRLSGPVASVAILSSWLGAMTGPILRPVAVPNTADVSTSSLRRRQSHA